MSPVAAVAAVSVAALLAWGTPAQASPLARGTLVDRAGTPAPGSVKAYILNGDNRRLHTVAALKTAPDGTFTIDSADPALTRVARTRGGVVDLLVDGETAGSIGTHVVSARLPVGSAAFAAAQPPPAPIRLRTRTAKPEVVASKGCAGIPPVARTLDTRVARTVVGEINNAYKDSLVTFNYGKTADTDFSVSVAPEGKGFSIDGENHIGNSNARSIFLVRRGPYARKISSKFLFKKIKIMRCGLNNDSEVIKADEWQGGVFGSRQRRTINVCRAGAAGNNYPGGTKGESSGFTRSSGSAVTWSFGVNVFGVGLKTKSGFSDSVFVKFAFGGPRSRKHRVCGSNGGTEFTGGRIFSGTPK